MMLKREALHWGRGSVKTTLLFMLEESKMPSLYDISESCNHAFAYDTGVCMSCGMSVASVRLSKPKDVIPGDTPRASWYAFVGDGERPFEQWADAKLCTFYAEVDVIVLGIDRFAELTTELTTRGIRDHAEREYQIARREGRGVWAREKFGHLPKDDVGIPYDPSAWAKLAESFEQREAALKESQDFLKRQGVPGVEITPTLEVAALTILHGSREKALDAWKAAHLGARAIKNNRDHADHLDACDMEREVDELSDAQTLQHAMNVPIAAEKSMRAQVLLREDD